MNTKRLKAPSGKLVCRRLQNAGIPIRKVARRMDSGEYVAEAYHPGMEEPVESAFLLAGQIQAVLEDARIISCNDRIAEWREGQPVIWASVTFKLSHQIKQLQGA